jgi:hypothetical protein
MITGCYTYRETESPETLTVLIITIKITLYALYY